MLMLGIHWWVGELLGVGLVAGQNMVWSFQQHFEL
jgi:hypothetical protein